MSDHPAAQNYRLGLTAACMACGLSAKESVQVHEWLSQQQPGATVEAVYRQVEEAVGVVKSMRHNP